MLILVESFPQPAISSAVAADRARGREWLASLKARGLIHEAFQKVGRGMIVIFSVSGPKELHNLLTEWNEFVPCTFESTPIFAMKEDAETAFDFRAIKSEAAEGQA